MKTLLKIANKFEYIIKNSQYYDSKQLEPRINDAINNLKIKGVKGATDVQVTGHQEENSASVGFLLNVESKFAKQMQTDPLFEGRIISTVSDVLNKFFPMYSGWKVHFTIMPV